MAQIFKKFSFLVLKTLSKKQVILIFAAIVLAVLFYPSPTYAAVISLTTIAIIVGISAAVSAIAGAAAQLAVKALTAGVLVATIASLIVFGGFFVMLMGSYVLDLAIANPFDLSFTNPAHNPIIQIGWTLLRDLVNMLFVLGLAYIGLATALNLGGFNTKKALPKLLLVALLVNFTPVICGVMVDSANMLTDFFLSDVSFVNYFDIYNENKSLVSIVARTILDPTNWLKILFLSCFSFFAGIILFIFGILLIIRQFAIWLLVIFSPIAFFAWAIGGVSEKIKSVWNMWWKWFLQWTFIAVPAGFLLYLSHQLLYQITAGHIMVKMTEPDSYLGKLIVNLGPYFLSLIFMAIAFYLTLKIDVLGSNFLIGGVKGLFTKVKALPGTLGAKAGQVAKTAVGAAAGAAAGSMVGGGIAGAKAGYAEGKAASPGGRIRSTLRGMGTAIPRAFQGSFTRGGQQYREEAEEATREGKRRVYGKMEDWGLVRPGFAEEQMAKETKIGDERKRIQGLNLSATKMRDLLSKVDRKRYKSAEDLADAAVFIEELVKKKKFDPTDPDDQALFGRYKDAGINMTEVYKKDPRWMDQFVQTEEDAERVTYDVLKEIKDDDVNRIAHGPNRVLKDAFMELFKEKNKKLVDEVTNLQKDGKKVQAKQLTDMISAVRNQVNAGNLNLP